MAVIHALVVDDFKPWRNFITAHLEEQRDLRVAGVAADGLEAIRKVEELQPDLVLLDIDLPGLNGVEAARQIRKLAPKCKIIFLSGHSDPELMKAALEAGGHGYVYKLGAITELLAGIEAVLLGKQYLSPSLEGLDDLI